MRYRETSGLRAPGLVALGLLACFVRQAETAETPAPFVDRAKEAGIDFVHDAGRTGQFYFPEIQGSGAALFDYDGDGDLDAFLLQGGSVASPGRSGDGSTPAMGRLYRNELVVRPDGTRQLRFVDVTEKSGIRTRGYGQGVAVGDYDNDGWPDLLVTHFGAIELWHNDGDGTFTERATKANVTSSAWNTSATFFDYDRDGWLDLYVTTYVDFTIETNQTCYAFNGDRGYCNPALYRGQTDRLFHNRGDGTFENVSAPAGVTTRGPGLGVIAFDADRDGWLDVYVANDARPNVLWHNQRDGTFRNVAVPNGCSVDRIGKPHSGMGIDAGDFDNDGDEDIVISNLAGEYDMVFRNLGDGTFEDRSLEANFLVKSLTGWGTRFFDYDNDGLLDVLVVNGAVEADEALARAGDPLPYRQRDSLFHNQGDGTFENVTSKAGKAFEVATIGRGAAFGDVDNDGDPDVLINDMDGPARLLINQVGQASHWVGLRLVGGAGKRDLVGARVTVVLPDGKSLVRIARADGSYQSANDPRVLVGLGDHESVSSLRVEWPDGKAEEWPAPPVDRYTTLVAGTGRKKTDSP